MARDPAVQHSERELRAGLEAVASGGSLDDRAALREELVFLGLLRIDDTEGVLLTPDGRRFLDR